MSADTARLMDEVAVRQAATLISYVGGEAQLDLVVAIRNSVDEIVGGL